MDYNIFSNIAPAMPKPSKGTEFVKFAISQASKDMQEVLIPMAIPDTRSGDKWGYFSVFRLQLGEIMPYEDLSCCRFEL